MIIVLTISAVVIAGAALYYVYGAKEDKVVEKSTPGTINETLQKEIDDLDKKSEHVIDRINTCKKRKGDRQTMLSSDIEDVSTSSVITDKHRDHPELLEALQKAISSMKEQISRSEQFISERDVEMTELEAELQEINKKKEDLLRKKE